ncbi:ABC transporter permease [Jatrophihabitans sp. YIM 134969]
MTETSVRMQKNQPEGGQPDAGSARRAPRTGPSVLKVFGPGRISIVYLYVLGFVLFSIWIPDVWLSDITHRAVLNIAFAVPGIAALALLLPLSAGAFDLSIAGTISATAVTTASLMVNSQWGMWSAIAAGMVVALLAGLVNGLLVVVVRINSFIATLATNAVLLAYAEWRSGGIQITGFSEQYTNLAGRDLFGGVQIKVLYLAVLAVVLWYVMEHTPFGRYLQATGDNPAAARLAGVKTSRYVYISLVVSALIAGVAGVIQTSTIGAGSATAGNSFLLPAFAAAFLGATQFKRRFNVWGTLAAIWVLASGVQGVTLAVGSFSWLNNLFFGVALIVAVGMSSLLERWQGFRAARARTAVARGNGSPPPSESPASPAAPVADGPAS